MTGHDTEYDLDDTVSDVVPSVDGPATQGPVAVFQPPRRREPAAPEQTSAGDGRPEARADGARGDLRSDLQSAADRRAAELRAAADRATQAQRERLASARRDAEPPPPTAPLGPDIESPFLELFDAEAAEPGAVTRGGTMPRTAPTRAAQPPVPPPPQNPAPNFVPLPPDPSRPASTPGRTQSQPGTTAQGHPQSQPGAAPGQPQGQTGAPGRTSGAESAGGRSTSSGLSGHRPGGPAGPARPNAATGRPAATPHTAPVSGVPVSGIPMRPPPDLRQRPVSSVPVSSVPVSTVPLSSRPLAPQGAPPQTGRHAAPAAPSRTGSRAGAKPVKAATPPKQKRDRDAAQEIAITEIAGHLTFTPHAVTAWYLLPEVRWAFRPDAEREALLSAISEQYAGLAGFRLHLRRTTRPFPADQWAQQLDQLTTRPLPAVPGAPGWGDHLVNAQRHLLDINHSEGQTFLGVTFARRALGDSFSEKLLRAFGKGTADSERKKLGKQVEQFDEVLAAFGMRGQRAAASDLEWLLYRSVALGMSPPSMMGSVGHGRWEEGDLLALTEQIERYRAPYGSTVKLVNRMTGEERHVAVLTVGRMEPLDIPERHEPWLHFHERLPWPMELSSRVDILGPQDSFRNLEHRLRMIRSQQLDYLEHGMDAPPELERLASRALVMGDEMTTGLPVDSARAHGWHRIAISGATRDECLERARSVIAAYSRDLRVALQHPKQQDQLAREFIPGEPIANTGYLRRMPVRLLAAALPQAASTVGDRRGDLLGRTAGTCRRPVFLDPHFPMEVRERSGLSVMVAEPGGGKSTLLGAMGYLNARRGVQVTLLDPSGPLARLASMPELRPYSRVLNLTGGEQGTLAPYSLIPTPQRTEFPPGANGDREYEIAVSNARAERRMLVQDICAMLVPPQVAREASTATLLRHAVRTVPAEETATLDDVVRCLAGIDDTGRELANLLLDTAEMPLALLFFGTPPGDLLSTDAALTVITMSGLRLPDLKIEREYWSAEEALALPMLHTAHRLAVRRCYSGDMHQRKLVGLDEAHFMEGWRSGRSFLVRLARDSRKWNLAALVASQNPKDILGLDVQNLVSTVFVGRIAQDPEIASEALRLLRVPTEVGYEEVLASLSAPDANSAGRLGYREFVLRDVDSRVQRVRVDVSYVPGLLETLDTTPTGQAEARAAQGGAR
ncbi:ATP-binding protein [Catellatospora sp. KI3]|uniref:ATP-binding protein n=1 Tax=Catellatospora sp. KI3 TaxID=3041620 RepID=UPI0024826311|nr:ATP-binding protein [Catellatospora sp. KI3]MDI1465092.1 ATP-binding protein [Catellatospora sp. KI3]